MSELPASRPFLDVYPRGAALLEGSGAGVLSEFVSDFDFLTEDWYVDLEIPSSQLTIVGDSLSFVDLAVRQATALLAGRASSTTTRRPRVSPLVGGLIFESLALGSAHARGKPHGQSKATTNLVSATAMSVLVSLVTTVGNDYLGPQLPGVPTPSVHVVTEDDPPRPASIILACGDAAVRLDTPPVSRRVHVPGRHVAPGTTVKVVTRNGDGMEMSCTLTIP